MIVTNPSGNCDTSLNINFYANLSYTNCSVLYTKKSDTSWINAKTASASYKTYGADSSSNPFYNKYSKNDSGSDTYEKPTFLDYGVTVSGLTPATEYMYKVFDGSAYSDVYYFKTSGASSFSFVWTSDFHAYYKNNGRVANAEKAINAAISLSGQLDLPKVEHVFSTGDITAWGSSYSQWQNVYDRAFIHNYSFANTIGNHDRMDRSSAYTDEYGRITANYPDNGYSGQQGVSYYYLYGGVLFIVTNYNATASTAQTWAGNVITQLKGSYRYIVLASHYPSISQYTGNYYTWQKNWSSFCDKYNVDLVIGGDHHFYARTTSVYGGSAVSGYSASNPKGTVYMQMDSSDGDRGISAKPSSFVSTVKASYCNGGPDITSVLVTVTESGLTTRFVYVDSTSPKTEALYEGTVSGVSNAYYGDTATVYPYDHGYNGSTVDPEDPLDPPTEPISVSNKLLSSEGGKYKYTSSNYAGKGYEDLASYTANYIDVKTGTESDYISSSFASGELNDGAIPSVSAPGPSNVGWSVWLGSSSPSITADIGELLTVTELSLYYYYADGGTMYGNPTVTSIKAGESESALNAVSYTVSVSNYSNSGSNYIKTMCITFASPVNARYISLVLATESGKTRTALGEFQIYAGVDGQKMAVTELYKNKVSIDEAKNILYAEALKEGISGKTVKEYVTGSNLRITDSEGTVISDSKTVSTGCVIQARSSTGEVIQALTIIVAGDVNGNGIITTTDYMIIKLCLSGTNGFSLDNTLKSAADVNGDGSVTVTDYAKLKEFFKGRYSR